MIKNTSVKLRKPWQVAAALMVGAGMLMGEAAVAESSHVCTPELRHVLNEWNAAGFQTPSKPAQMYVYGKDGRVSSGPEVTHMASLIRQAIADCKKGDLQAVQESVALVKEKLERAKRG